MVDNPEIRPLLEESILSYNAGAFRSSIISLWVATAADLTEKIRFLGETGNKEAANLISKLDTAAEKQKIAQMQDFENELIKRALHFDFINNQEKDELNRLYRDRNNCAHPNFVDPKSYFKPSEELTRSHIANITRDILAKSPQSGKSIIKLFCSEIKNPSWPNDLPSLTKYIKNRYYKKTTQVIQNNLTKIIIKGCLEDPPDEKGLIQKHRKCCLAILGFNPQIIEDMLSDVLKGTEERGTLTDKKLLRSLGAFGSLDFYIDCLDQSTSLIRLKKLLEQSPQENGLSDDLYASGVPKDPDLAKLYDDLLPQLDDSHLQSLTANPDIPKEQFIPIILKRLKSAQSFRNADKYLQCLSYCSDFLDISNIKELCSITLNNDQIYESFGADKILTSIAETSIGDNEENCLNIWLETEKELQKKFNHIDGDYNFKLLKSFLSKFDT